jgi:hypothetical protein
LPQKVPAQLDFVRCNGRWQAIECRIFFKRAGNFMIAFRLERRARRARSMEKCFDIIPHATGWIYVLDGKRSASYPSYGLALKAAKSHAERELETLRRPIFRRQEVSGEMIKVMPQPPMHSL